MDSIPMGEQMNSDTKGFVKHMLICMSGLIMFIVALNGLAYLLFERADAVEVNYVGQMKASEAESVIAIINAEGFDQAFNHYSTYKDINDTKFHDLRKAYIAASKELMDYIAESAGKVSNTPYYLSHESSN